MGHQRRRVLDAARRRAEPADDQASPADCYFPRVPVHDVGHAPAAARGRRRRRVLRVHVVCLQARDRSRRGQPRLFRTGAAFTGKDDSAGNVGPGVLSRRDHAGLHPPVLRIAPARIESLVRLSRVRRHVLCHPPSRRAPPEVGVRTEAHAVGIVLPVRGRRRPGRNPVPDRHGQTRRGRPDARSQAVEASGQC